MRAQTTAAECRGQQFVKRLRIAVFLITADVEGLPGELLQLLRVPLE